MLIDLGFESREELRWMSDRGIIPRRLYLTHAHVDHMAGVGAFRQAYPGVPVIIHEAEAGFLPDPERNLSAYMGSPVSEAEADEFVTHGDSFQFADATWHVIHVPGHSPGNTALHVPSHGVVFCGDALFQGSVGRTDFPGGSMEILSRSIRERLYALPGETQVLPGHGPATTIASETAHNPYVRG